jgi:hypothetical protein
MRPFLVGCLVLATLLLWQCASGPTGGPVMGAASSRCSKADGGATVQETSMAACHPDGGMAMMANYGDTLFNQSGADDDCKYDLSWTSTAVRENTDVTFTATVRSRVDSSVVTGANVVAEVFLNDKHPAPNSDQATHESPMGTYAIGPVRFDASGQWTVRFHIFEDCEDTLPTSPHGHIAFFVDVP